jgi:dolichyl-phosphate-mannose--protein O-mannosyl transferase
MPSIAPRPSKYPDLSPLLFWCGMVGIFLISLALRFWGLSRFNTLVFDEVYYARFASHFLKGELIFTGHPPLSTYIVAIGIWSGQWISQVLPWVDDSLKNGLSGLFLSTFSYRWLNAFTGSIIPLLVAGIAYLLSHRRSFALLAGLLMAADGLYLVESRYALNNVYLVSFGLLGHLGFLLALRAIGWQQWLWLSLAGVGFGAAASIKWNGLGFLLGAYVIWISYWVWHWIEKVRTPKAATPTLRRSPFPLNNLHQLHLGHILICFALIPAFTYYASWIPYMQLDGNSFWTLQLQTLDYHGRVGGLDAHPYCSLWYTWPLMLRPIAYFYQIAHAPQEPPPVIGPPTPVNAAAIIYDVHAMGNPFLWWLSTVAIGLLTILTVQRFGQRLGRLGQLGQNAAGAPSDRIQPIRAFDWVALYLLINWAANLLPWAKVTRCVFIYHYMGSLVFAVLSLALITDRWFWSSSQLRKVMATAIVVLVLLAFAFWMPIYLGLPLTPSELQMRRWLPSWV